MTNKESSIFNYDRGGAGRRGGGDSICGAQKVTWGTLGMRCSVVQAAAINEASVLCQPGSNGPSHVFK